MAHQDMLQTVRLLKKRIVDRQHRSARITEDMLDTLVHKRFDHHFGAVHFFAHCFAPHFAPSEIKKGRKGPFTHRRIVDGLAIPGGAPPYRYQSRNKISHFSYRLPFPCAPL
jgi:hypothetical protein